MMKLVTVGGTPLVPIAPSESELQVVKKSAAKRNTCSQQAPQWAWRVPWSHPILVHAFRLATVSPLQGKPGRKADVNCQGMETNDNWVVIQPKYLFHGFFCTTRIRFSVGVKKKKRIWERREGFRGENKGSGKWGGGAGVCRRKLESLPTIAESSFSSHSHVCFEDVAISWHFAAVLGTAWAKLTPPHFSEPQASESFLLPPQSLKPSCLPPFGLPTPFLPPSSGQDSSPQIGQSQAVPIGDLLFNFHFFKRRMVRGEEGPPSIAVVVLLSYMDWGHIQQPKLP